MQIAICAGVDPGILKGGGGGATVMRGHKVTARERNTEAFAMCVLTFVTKV